MRRYQLTSLCGGLLLLFTQGVGHAPAGMYVDDEVSDAQLRARAWATILLIGEKSVRTIEARDQVAAHRSDGRIVPMADYTFRADEFRNGMVWGKNFFTHEVDGKVEVETRNILASHVDGVLRGVNAERGTAIVWLEHPEMFAPWGFPGIQRGLGHSPVHAHIASRAERLLSLPDLRIEREDSGAVVLRGTQRDGHRTWFHRAEVQPEQGTPIRHQMIEPIWGMVAAERSMPAWAEVSGVQVPVRVESRLFELSIDEETKKKLREAKLGAGIGDEAMDPDSPDFERWVRVRDEVFGNGPAPTRLIAGEWLACDSKVVEVNRLYDRTSFALPQVELKTILSQPLQCQLNRLEPEP